MSDEAKKILKENGITVNIIQTWQFWLTIISTIIVLAITWGATINRLGEVEKDVIVHTEWIKAHTDNMSKTGNEHIKLFYELQHNLKRLCEKQGVSYEPMTTESK